MENQQLKQRQAALDATLEMQQKLQAAAAAHAASDLGTASDLGDDTASFSLDLAPSMTRDGTADMGGGGSDMDDEDVESLLADLAASAEDRSAGSGAGGALAAGPAGDLSVPSGPVTRTSWFFAASLRQHVLWYKGQVRAPQLRPALCCCHRCGYCQLTLRPLSSCAPRQVCRVVALLAVLERIPPRLRRSLEDYKLHEETMEALNGVLSDIVSGSPLPHARSGGPVHLSPRCHSPLLTRLRPISPPPASHQDDWTVHMAALRPVDFGMVLHNDLQQLLEGSSATGGGRQPDPCFDAAAAAAWAAADAQGETSIWQGLVAALALTPQQEQTLEAHQALFEQRAAALQDSKEAVLAALGSAAAKGNDQDAALDMLQVGCRAARAWQASMRQTHRQAANTGCASTHAPTLPPVFVQGAEALRASLQEDLLVKAPVMISLRKVGACALMGALADSTPRCRQLRSFQLTIAPPPALLQVLTPLQMARLTVGCWPYHCTMKNVSRAHKQRRLAAAQSWKP